MYKLHGRVRSRALRTLWMLEEVGADYAYVSVMPRSPEARALNPRGTVPILETPEGPILDSVAQMQFLADRHGAMTHPAGSHARARQDAFALTVLEVMDANLWTLALHGFGLPEDMRVPAIAPVAKALVARGSETLAGLMDGDCAVGDAPTVADVLLAHCAGWARGLKIDLDDRVLAHMRRMRERPAFSRAMAHAEADG